VGVRRIVSLSTMPHVNEDSFVCRFPTALVITLCRPATCNACRACLKWCLTRDDWTDDQQRSCMDNPNVIQKCALSSDAVVVHNPACMMYLPESSDLFRLYRRRETAELKPSSRHGRFLGRFGRRVLTGARTLRMTAMVAPACISPHMVTTMDSNRKRKHDHVRLQETKSLTFQGDGLDIYDVPDSPPPTKRTKNGSWRPWDLAQNTPGDTICVSTPDTRAETIHRKESSLSSIRHAGSRKQPTMIAYIQEALETGPDEGLTTNDIFDWVRINVPRTLEQRGPGGLRKFIEKTLDQQPNKKKPKIWCDKGGNWRLYEDPVAKPNEEENTGTQVGRCRYTSPLLIPSSVGRPASHGTPELHENTPQSHTQHTGERDHENGQDLRPAAFSQIEFNDGPIHNDTQPQVQAQEMDTNGGNETTGLRAATLRAQASDEQASNNDDRPTQHSDPPVEIASTIHNDKPSGIEEARVLVDSCDGPK